MVPGVMERFSSIRLSDEGGEHSTPPSSWENHAAMIRDAESLTYQEDTELNEAA